jgi:hypothetical protein
MEKHPHEESDALGVEELERVLEEVDAADTAETAEEIARRLGSALDEIEPGERGAAP